jgi:hypothetical protein
VFALRQPRNKHRNHAFGASPSEGVNTCGDAKARDLIQFCGPKQNFWQISRMLRFVSVESVVEPD